MTSCATSDGTFGWLNTVSLHFMKKTLVRSMFICVGCLIGFGCYH